MEPSVDSESRKDHDPPTEPVVRKGRRGLAKKKTAPTLSQDVPSSSISHNTSIYSSCVSRGYRNMFGEIGSAQGESECQSGNNASTSDTIKDDKERSVVDTKSESDAAEELHKKASEFCEEEKQAEEISEDEEIIALPASDPNSLRSPTPPPMSEGITQPKKRRMNRKLSSALKTLNMAKGNLNTPFTKARGRARGKRLSHTYPYADIDSNTILPEDSSPVMKTDMVIKVRYLSNIHRFQMKLTDQFHNLLTNLSQETEQEEQYLSLYLRDQALSLSNTPKEVGLTVADIIECHCMKDANGSDLEGESISLLIQCSNSKRKTEMNVTMRQPFSDVLEKYAEQVGIKASSYSLCFDGDDVGPKDTPFSLELEDGDILDLVPASKPGARSRSAWQNSVITII